MTQDEALEGSRIRLEGRLSALELAPAQYSRLTSRRLVDWTEADLEALADLEASTADTLEALEGLFPGVPLPPPERALGQEVERARSQFLLELHRRLIGPVTHWRSIDVAGLLRALREAREIAAAPLYMHPLGALTEPPWWKIQLRRYFEPCVLGLRGLLVGERLIRREDIDVSFSGDEDGAGNWRIEPDVVLANEEVAMQLQRFVKLMDFLDGWSFTAPPTPSTPVFVGTDLTVTPATHAVVITEKGLFHLPVGVGLLSGSSFEGFRVVLAGLPGSHLHELLADQVGRYGEHLPLEDLAQPFFEGDRLCIRWRQATLEIQFPAGSGHRVSRLLMDLMPPEA